MTIAPGVRLGAYEILDRLGAGGMGEVYRAHDTALGRDVAIKVLPEAVAADAERLARFEREARLLASLNHPNIAAIYGLERSGATTCLAMELAAGETLAARIARGRVPIDDALPIALQIAAALEAAHDKGIVHRDLKPANVVVSPNGKVKVLDFGLAKLVDPAEAGHHGSEGEDVRGVRLQPDRPADLTHSPTLACARIQDRTGKCRSRPTVAHTRNGTATGRRYAFGSAQTIPNYDVSPDGQRFVMVKDDSSSGRLNIVLNWFEELKRLAPTK